ncbi:MAG: SAM-dependent methyltransferase [Sulfuritalea sp.]|nr:SAM-dependent methyltransferase [Sulfuritalea sp.]
MTAPSSLTTPMTMHLAKVIAQAQGWIGFDVFMAEALYAPGLGYYANDLPKFGAMPTRPGDTAVTSDFVTAPEMTPLFATAFARQIAQALAHTQTDELWEFGAGTGALAQQLLNALAALGVKVRRYTIVDISSTLKERQRARLIDHVDVVQWVSALPAAMNGVVIGNEVLDAMPVQMLSRVGGVWHERGVALISASPQAENQAFMWQDRPSSLRPPMEVADAHDYLTEIHAQAQGFVQTLADRLQTGAVFLLDYGFPESEYYHPQRHMGTVMCHQAHQSDSDPLRHVGHKDITAHVNFTGIALAAQDAGLEVLGYTNQAHFLMNCGIVSLMQAASLPERVAAQKLIMEHEMGELFKVIALGKGAPWTPLGFAHGDKMHCL